MPDRYILVDGEPVPEPDLMKWARWFENPETRRLARDKWSEEGEDVTVSTVFLGLDHSYEGGVPVLWETMVFGGRLDGEQQRYTSRQDALAGHAEMVTRVKKESQTHAEDAPTGTEAG